MTRGLKYLLLAVLVSWSPLLSAEELIKNPSFEESADVDDEKSDRAVAWGRWGAWINRETGWGPVKSGECLLGYHHWRIKDNNSSGVYQDIESVTIGNDYDFSIYVFLDSENGLRTNADSIELRLEPYRGGESFYKKIYTSGDLKSNTWQKLHVGGPIFVDKVRVVLVVTPFAVYDGEDERHGAVKFDDASFVVVE